MEASTDPPPRRRQRRKQREETQDRNTTTTVSETSILELPSHITCDILSRLPLSAIFSCKRVCSSFRNLTLEPYFPQLHLPRSPLCLILYTRPHFGSPISFGFIPLDDSLVDLRRRRATTKLETKVQIIDDHANFILSMVSLCNGLICLAINSLPDVVYVCNPVTGKHFRLTTKLKNQPSFMNRPQGFIHNYGFGYSRSTYLYTVVKFTTITEKPSYKLHCCVYTLGVDDEWRTLGDTGQPVSFNYCFVFLNGAFHWVGSKESMLLLCYFDMEKEQCGNLFLPKPFPLSSHLDEHNFHIGVVDNCLCLCDKHMSRLAVNIWVMKDYGSVGSWTLEWIIRAPLLSELNGWYLQPVKALKDGSLLMIVGDKTLVSYNPVTRVLQRMGYNGVEFWDELIAGVPSFLPLP